MSTPIRNILVANRGEIAMRIIRTIRRLGLTATGIYSGQDKHAPWIEQCDQAWWLGDGRLADTYLNIDRIISTAKQSGADAIHPGYGFLAENFRFAEACLRNNITFIGPSPEVLKIAGNKQASHDLARTLGIPVPEKMTGTPDELLSNGKNIHFPVLAKAVAGGGGKGIRLAGTHEELNRILRTVSDEALNYFGDDRIFLEQYIPQARHIEIQLLADQHGNYIHLFERECSIQRRHQKLIEESPATYFPGHTKESLTKAALAIAKHLHYTSAGTIEFLLDTKGDFYFLEINPRIQVEHGLTEMLTGIDIVREQIHIAQGLELSLQQHDITGSGHAIEARICAEDPENFMLPSPGKIHYFSIASGENIRIDTGVENGSEIFPDFDPLIAKIMVHGTSRQDAIQRMQHAIRQSVITGVQHNLPLHARIFSDDDFVNNEISTTWLDDKYAGISASLTERRLSADHIVLGIAASIIVLFRKPAATDSPWNSGFWRNIRQIRFRVGGKLTELEYYQAGKDEFCFYHDSREHKVNKIKLDDFRLEFRLNETIHLWYIVPEKDGIIGLSDGHTEYSVERYALLKQDYALTDEIGEYQSNTVIAPQPGTILEIRVSEGQQVSRGDYLLTIESMKLENTILARQAGIVKKINIKTGDRVKKNEPLIYLQETITNKLN